FEDRSSRKSRGFQWGGRAFRRSRPARFQKSGGGPQTPYHSISVFTRRVGRMEASCMSVFRHIRDLFTDPSDIPELTLAQWKPLTRQLPLLYAMLVSNTLILAWTHFDVAPLELTLYVPAALTLFCCV